MADTPQFSTSTQPTLQQLVDYFVEALHDPKRLKNWQTLLRDAMAEAGVIENAALTKTVDPVLEILAAVFFGMEEHVEKLVGPALARIASHLMGSDVSIADLRKAANAGEESNVGKLMATLAMGAMTPKGETLEPGAEGAQRFLSVLTQLVFSGWFEGTAFELITTAVPDMDGFESVAELPHELVNALGLGRLARRALGPLAEINISKPLEWALNKAYRPTLLGPSTVLREFTRGRWDWDDVEEELARAGYSSERINALLSEQVKRLAVDDLSFLVWNEIIVQDEALRTLKEEGYDEQTASKHLNAKKIAREDAIRDDLATAAIAAYVDRRIDDGQLEAVIADSITSSRARDLLAVVARGRRALNFKILSPAEAKSCVKAGILAVADYRQALASDGYTDEAALALELLLRHELDEKLDVEKARAEALAERAAAQAAKKAAADAKAQEIAATLALKRRGSLSELEHAAVVGLIPIARLEEVLAAQFDADTVGIYVADVEQQRAAYVAQQKKRDDAAKRVEAKGLNVGELEQAVYAGVLTVDEFRTRIASTGLAAADVDVLARTLAVKLADLRAAKANRDQAAARAAKKGLSLDTLEQLVLRGLRTIAEYDRTLESLGYDVGARAGMVELLKARIQERKDAAALRGGIGAGDVTRGLSLEQFRKAVIAGQKTLAEFQTYLVGQKYTIDAQAVLVDELASDVDAAAVAQQRRLEADAAVGRSGIAVSTAARAARLGLVTPDAYRAALEAAGYSDEQVGLELELLVAEMATSKAAQKVAAATSTPTSTHGLTLAQVAAAVKVGAATRADFVSAAAAAGLDDDASATLTAQLDDELAAIADAKGRRQQFVPALAAAGVDLADLENAVRAKGLTVAAFEAQLAAYGASPADAQLIGSLLEQELAAP